MALVIDPNKFAKLINPKAHLSQLLFKIILLEKQLDNPEKQSEYFRWGVSNQSLQLAKLTNKYESLRTECNRLSIDDILKERNEIQYALKSPANNTTTHFIRALRLRTLANRMETLYSYLNIKKLGRPLPAIRELKKIPNLLVSILEIELS